MSILVVAEHKHEALIAATLNCLSAARQLGDEVHVLVAGTNCQAAADEAAALEGVSKVLMADDPAYQYGLAENIAPLIAGLAADYSHVLAPASFFGKNIMPRVAAQLDVQQISDITAIESADTFQRPIYAGNAIATVQTSDAIKIITTRSTAFEPAATGSNKAAIETLASTGDAGLSQFVSEELTQSNRPELATANIIVSGGRGVGSKEAFETLEKLADKLGAAVGASRAAVDAGFVPNDYQVGQTGKVVAPQLYIAIGISGAIQHLAGMKDSKVIVAINTDPDAPIFQVADFGLVMDWQQALSELQEKL